MARLLAHSSASTFDITAIVRSPEKAEKLKSFGVTPVVGSLQDLSLLEELTSKAHVVLHCAHADDLPATHAMLKGLRNRHTTTGDLPIFIHTSGTGLLTYKAADRIYDDSDADDIEKTFPEEAPHHNVDLAIVRADQEGYARSYIILPSTIWGNAKNPLVDAGIMNPLSQQIPDLVKTALPRRRTGVVGTGLTQRSNVNIDELVDLYIILYDAVTKDPEAVGHGRNGYYFGVGGHHTWYDVSKEVGKVLVGLGLVDDAEPTPFTSEELAKYFGSLDIGMYWSDDARGVPTHSKSIGWDPKKDTQDMLANIKAEVEAVLKQQRVK